MELPSLRDSGVRLTGWVGAQGAWGGWVVTDPREVALSRDVEEVRTCRGVLGRGGEGTGRDGGRGGTP